MQQSKGALLHAAVSATDTTPSTCVDMNTAPDPSVFWGHCTPLVGVALGVKCNIWPLFLTLSFHGKWQPLPKAAERNSADKYMNSVLQKAKVYADNIRIRGPASPLTCTTIKSEWPKGTQYSWTYMNNKLCNQALNSKKNTLHYSINFITLLRYLPVHINLP